MFKHVNLANKVQTKKIHMDFLKYTITSN